MIRKLAVALALSLPIAAQVTETIEVAVTSVDVVVTDARGDRVRGLTREDFEVLEDGKLREITNFSEYTLTAPAIGVNDAAATVSPARSRPIQTPPRRLLLVFDSNTLSTKHRRNGAADALKFVDKHVRPTDKVLVAVLTQQFTTRTDWTSDRTELRRAIEAIGSEVTALGADAELKRAEEEMIYLRDIASSTVGTQPPVSPPQFGEFVAIARRYADHALLETRNTASLIEKLVAQFAVYPEKKALIFIGEGLDSRPGWEIFEKLESIRAGKDGSSSVQIMLGATQGTPNERTPTGAPTPLVSEAARYNASSLLQNLADAAYRRGVPIYAINPGTNEEADIGTTALSDTGQQFARFASRLDGYKLVGDGSGGAAYVGMRAELALEQVATDIGNYYSIGFRASGPPKRAAIKVKPKRAGQKVRVSLAGTPISPVDAVSDAVTAHHVLEPATNDLEIALEALEPIPAGEKQKVTLHVIIPIRNLTLVRQGDDVTGGFDVYLSISDGKSYFSTVNKQSHAIKWSAATTDADEERTVTYSIDVTMEPGASQISVGVVDQRSKKTGYERIEVEG